MKQLICEMCGGTDLIKQEGVFVCQSCGTKYSVEEAKKMMVEGTVEVTGTVRVDDTDKVENYLSMASKAYNASNQKEAEEYANKVIEIAPKNSEAWFIKGQAAGWQSTLGNNRLSESIDCWENAIEFSPEEDKEGYRERAAIELDSLMLAMLNLCTKNFSNYPSDDNAQQLVAIIKSNGLLAMQAAVHGMKSEGHFPWSSDGTSKKILNALNNAAIAGKNKADKDYGPDKGSRNRFAYTTYIEYMSRCIIIMKLAMTYARTEADINQIYKNYVDLQETLINSFSWKFDPSSWAPDHYVKDTSLTAAAIQARRNEIEEARKKRDEMIAKIKEEWDKERQKAADAYWKEHAQEKIELEKERDELNETIASLNTRIANIPERDHLVRLQTEINNLENDKSALGVFKGKEKRALQDKINSLMPELERMRGQLNSVSAPLVAQLNAAKERLDDIETMFFDPR